MKYCPPQMTWLILVNFLLTACACMDSPKMRRAACNELKSEIILSTATSNDREAEIQRAETYLERQNFNKSCQY